MRTRSHHVVVFRSSRYLDRAVAAVRSRWAACEVAVVHQPGRAEEAAALGVPIEYATTSRFRVLGWFFSSARRALSAWGPHMAVVQIPDETGEGHFELGLVALIVGRGQFWSVRPDGSLHHVRARDWLRRAVPIAVRELRGLAIVGVVALLSVAAWPGWLTARARWHLHDRGWLRYGEP